MTRSINLARVDASNASEVDTHHLVCDASDLGFPVGEPPPIRLYTPLGNGQPFLLVSASCAKFRYEQGNGCLSLVVFND